MTRDEVIRLIEEQYRAVYREGVCQAAFRPLAVIRWAEMVEILQTNDLRELQRAFFLLFSSAKTPQSLEWFLIEENFDSIVTGTKPHLSARERRKIAMEHYRQYPSTKDTIRHEN